jgi:DNA-binding NarL/FixJ family response regulator
MDLIRVVVIASSVTVKVGLNTLLQTDPDIDVVRDYDDISTTIKFPDIDVVVIYGVSVSPSGINQIADNYPQAAPLILTEDPGVIQFVSSSWQKAWGILPLDASAEAILSAVHALSEGLIINHPSFMGGISAGNSSLSDFTSKVILETLTDREMEVLQLLALGLANKQIAQELGISPNTVKFHVSLIYDKLGVTNRTEAVRRGIQGGLISL